ARDRRAADDAGPKDHERGAPRSGRRRAKDVRGEPRHHHHDSTQDVDGAPDGPLADQARRDRSRRSLRPRSGRARGALSACPLARNTGNRGAPRLPPGRDERGGVWGAISGPPYSEGRGVLETADELAGVGGEGPALGGRDRLARDELLAERIDEAPVLRDAIVEVGARREPGGADVADHLALRDAPAGADARAEARAGVVHR